jgi:hypothetical protein
MTEKLKIRFEYEKDGPLQVVRPHRQFFGRQAVAEPLLVEIEFEEDEALYACMCKDDEDVSKGRTVLVGDKAPGLVVTADPGLFGTDDERMAAGKLTFVRLKWGEWNILNLSEL